MSDRARIQRAIEVLSVASDEEADRRDKGFVIDLALTVLRGAALPTAWTREPPKEPGHYWVRTSNGLLWMCKRDDRGLWFGMGVEDVNDDTEWPKTTEFWPVAIRPPEG